MKNIMEHALSELLSEKHLAQYGRLLVMTALKINAEANAVMQSIVAAGIEDQGAEPDQPLLPAATHRTARIAEPAPRVAKRSGAKNVETVDGWLTRVGATKALQVPASAIPRIDRAFKIKSKMTFVKGPDGRNYKVRVYEPNSLEAAIKAYYGKPAPKKGRPVKDASPKAGAGGNKYLGSVAGAALGLSASNFYHHAKRLGVGVMTSRPGVVPAKLYSTADIMLVSKDMGIPFNSANLNGTAG